MADSSLNPDLKELHGMLVTQSSALADRLGEATTFDEVRKIQDEITELNHRVTLVGNLLFTQQTKGITTAMDRVRDAESEIDEATGEIEKLTDFLRSMTKFLTLVDKVIDTAKMVAPIAAL